MTIHQPSWQIFCQLDRVILLAQGAVFYDGPPRETVPYFAALGYDVPEGTNPADHFISIAENLEKDEAGARRVRALIDAWAGRQAGSRDEKDKEDAVDVPGGSSEKGVPQHKEAIGSAPARTNGLQDFAGWPIPWWKEFYILVSRAWLEIVGGLIVTNCAR